jgi:hypothetical protein
MPEVSEILANRSAADHSRFSSNATHSTWCVIGKTPTVLSVHAILCGRRRSGGETGL